MHWLVSFGDVSISLPVGQSATAGIAIKQAILRGDTIQGLASCNVQLSRLSHCHTSYSAGLRINVKFGTAELPSAVPNFTLIRKYLGLPAKKREKLPKLPTFSPRRSERLARCWWNLYGFMRAIGLQKLLTFWCDSVSKLAIYRQKTAMGHPPSSETTGRIEKNEGGAKMVRTSSIFGKGVTYLTDVKEIWQDERDWRSP